MVSFLKKPRTVDELLADPDFIWRVSQLMGAAEMAAFWMSLQEDPTTKQMGERLERIASWFYREEKIAPKL